MAANWNNPLISSLYVDVLANLKERDVDVLTMNPGTNIPVDSKRWNAATNTFQNWNGSTWVNLVLAGAGGGTGSSTPVALGTMATQNSNAVAITGGTITGVALNAGDLTSGIVALARGGTGATLALGANGSFLQSNGSQVVFGVNGAALTGLNAAALSFNQISIDRMPTGGTWNLTSALEILSTTYVRIQSPSGLVVGGIAAMGNGAINAVSYYLNGVLLSFGVPTGMMAYFSGPCPTGWTFVANSHERIVRSVNNGTGLQHGSLTHDHPFSVPIVGINSGPAIGEQSGLRSMGGNNRSFDAGSSFSGFLPSDNFLHDHTIGHTHNFNYPGHNGNTDLGGAWPPAIDFTLCRKD
jgi:hypothetical protein